MMHGLGAIQSPLDDRDYPIEALYAALGVAPPDPLTLAAVYASAPIPPILDQDGTPQCTCYGTAGVKQFQDYDDAAPKWYDFDEDLLFRRVNGGPGGAVVRDVLDELLKVGYPLKGNAAAASAHKIGGYYSIPIMVEAIKQAIATLGEIVIGMTWANSWFTPRVNGVLPSFDYPAGGHLVRARGWDDSKGIRIPNTWGTLWGVNGECYLPYAYLNQVWEAWKAPDQPKPLPVLYHWHVAARAMVKVYGLSPAGLILPGWTTTAWGLTASSAPCTKPVYRKTVGGRSGATTVKILSGHFAGKTVGASPPGTSVT